MRRARRLALAALIVMTAGCVADTRPDPSVCRQPELTVETTLRDEGLAPSDVAVCRDQVVTLPVTAELDGVLHIHGYDEQAAEVREGEVAVLEFAAVRSGQFPIELHTDDAPEGVSVGTLTVHEP